MKKYFSALLVAPLFFGVSAFAQSSNSNSALQNSGTAVQNSGSSSSTTTKQGAASDQNSAQSSTNSGQAAAPSSSNSSQSALSSSSNTQASSGNSASAADESLEGCVVKQETDYFIQPVSGSRVHLNAKNQHLSGYVGQDVRVHGRHWDPNAQNNENSSQASSQPSGAPVTGAVSTGKGQDFLVDRVDVVSATCPANGSASNPQR